MSELLELTGGSGMALASYFASGRVKPSEVVRFLLERIVAHGEDNIFLLVTRERAMEEALASDERYSRGAPLSPLDGVPIAWKDLFDLAGTVTTAGSSLLARSAPAKRDAAAVASLAAAGLVTLGKLNTSEFAYSGLGLNPHFGTPRNPRDKRVPRSPGGSSSGSGAAVAANLACCAIGTDTGGSIRVPAAFNGVVGLKTSTGRVSKEGMFQLSRSMDTVGPLARSVEDCAVVFRLLQGCSAPRIPRKSLAGLHLLCPTNYVLDGLDTAVERNFEDSIRLFESCGAVIRREFVPAISEMADLTLRHGNLVAAEAYTEHSNLVDGPTVAEIDRRVVYRILGGKRMSARDVLTINRERVRCRQLLEKQMGSALLVMPTTPNTAPAIEPLEADDDLFHSVNLHTLRNVSLGNALDLCALAIPNGQDEHGLPTSILFTAVHGQDEVLLGYGMEFERVLQSGARFDLA